MSTEELRASVSNAADDIKKARKAFKRQVSMDAEYWENYSTLIQLNQTHVGLQSKLSLQSFTEQAGTNVTEDDWHHRPEAQDLMAQLHGWEQFGSIAKKHISKMQERFKSGRQNWVNLFATSKLGFNLEGGVGRRDTSHQSNFAQEMVKAYCPDTSNSQPKNHRWDPVLRRWGHSELIHAAHLFPWAQKDFMNDIFGDGAIEEIFKPCNGLFLHVDLEKALDKGHIAIVPDVELEPRNPHSPQDDQAERQDRIREWESKSVKEYKVIVVSQQRTVIEKIIFHKDDNYGVSTLQDLHNRKLIFKTTSRPRARYVWWAFLNTILRTAWTSKNGDQNVQHAEVRKVTRYWGTRGRYVMQNQLLGFIEELGQDVNSIVDYAITEEGNEEADPCAITVAVCDAIQRSASAQKEKGDELAEDGSESESQDENE